MKTIQLLNKSFSTVKTSKSSCDLEMKVKVMEHSTIICHDMIDNNAKYEDNPMNSS